MSCDAYIETLTPLFHDFTVVFHDYRGTGRSSEVEIGSVSLDRIIADIMSLIDENQVSILGHSFGGGLALEIAATYPQLVDRLILVATSPAQDYGQEIAENLRKRKITPEQIAAFTKWPPQSDEEMAEAAIPLIDVYVANPMESGRAVKDAFGKVTYHADVLAQLGKEMRVWTVANRLSSITASTFIAAGEHDFLCPPSQAFRMGDNIEKSHVEIFEESGHFPWIEQPNEFFPALRMWLDLV
ncbi:MAG: alpha/beta hydrolase [Actinobacteria bacterium]|nr:alpha/beta hydrolase [Actinomycetota bacterium]